LLDISTRIDEERIAVYEAIALATRTLGLRFVIVGAAARDLVMHHGYGARIARATTDVDIGIQVGSWSDFQSLRAELLRLGFQATRTLHRLVSPEGPPIDIVPFGGIADSQAQIAWPPTGDEMMSVLGFREACDSAEIVRLRAGPPLDVPVATPAGIVLLKIIAWSDRRYRTTADAKDILYFLETYGETPHVTDRMYGESPLMDQYEWDVVLAGANLLGRDVRAIANRETADVVEKTINPGAPEFEHLVEDMADRLLAETDRNIGLLSAFADGFSEVLRTG